MQQIRPTVLTGEYLQMEDPQLQMGEKNCPCIKISNNQVDLDTQQVQLENLLHVTI